MKLPAFWSAIIFITGILIGKQLALPDLILFSLAILFLIAGIVIYLRDIRPWGWLVIAASLFMVAIFRIGLDSGLPPNNDISFFNDLGEKVTAVGEIIKEPDLRPAMTFLTIRADSVIFRSTHIPVYGQAIIKLNYPTSAYSYADRVRIAGFLSTPASARNPGSFDYQKYLLTKRIRSYMSIYRPGDLIKLDSNTGSSFLAGVVIPLRKYILATFSRHLEAPQRALIAGFLIGDTRLIPLDIFQKFRDTGTLHLLAVSGSNVALVIGTMGMILLLLRVPRNAIYIISLPVIFLFSGLSYNQPSVVRASVMLALVLIGKLAFRRVNYINIISVSALLILMFDPLMLWDVGFQLSFAATFGLIYALPIIYRKMPHSGNLMGRIWDAVLLIILSSIVAQLAVAPILAYNFNTVPLVGFLANLIVIPLSSLAVIASLVLSIVGWFQPLAHIVGMIADPLLKLTILAVSYFARLPVAKLNLAPPDWIMIMLYYLMLILAFEVIRHWRHIKYLLFVALVFLNIVVWREYLHQSDQSAALTVLDVGSSEAFNLQLSDRQNFLFTDLKGGEAYMPIERVIVPYYINQSIHQLDDLIQFHSDSSDLVDSVLRSNGIKTKSSAFLEMSPVKNSGTPHSERLTIIRSTDTGSNLGFCYKYSGNEIAAFPDYDTFGKTLMAKPILFQNLRALIVPEPEIIDDKILEDLGRVKMRYLIFCGYKNRFADPPGYERLSDVINRNNVIFLNSRFSGAIMIQIKPDGLEIKPFLPDRN